MLLFTIIALHLPLALTRLIATGDPTGLAPATATAPVPETRTVLLPVTGAIVGLMGRVLLWILIHTYLLYHSFVTCGTDLKLGSK